MSQKFTRAPFEAHEEPTDEQREELIALALAVEQGWLLKRPTPAQLPQDSAR